jgi:hypothetical protein
MKQKFGIIMGTVVFQCLSEEKKLASFYAPVLFQGLSEEAQLWHRWHF